MIFAPPRWAETLSPCWHEWLYVWRWGIEVDRFLSAMSPYGNMTRVLRGNPAVLTQPGSSGV